MIKFVNYGGLFLTLVAGFVSVMSNTITSVSYSGGSRNPQYGNLFGYFEIILIVLFILIFTIAGINYLRSEKPERQHVRYLLIGITITLILIIFSDVISPLFTGSNYLSNFDAYSLIFLFGFTAYSIIKHQLFEIRIILTETAVFIVGFAVFVQILLSSNWFGIIVNSVVFILIILGSYLLIKSVKHEIEQKKELQLLSNELSRANKKLKEVDALKTEFISMASHELLTPISAIEGYLSIICDEGLVKIEDPKAKKYLDSVYQSSKRLARLVADLLNVSRIEQGRLLIEKVDLDLKKVVAEVVAELKFKAEEKKQKIEVSIEPNADFTTFADLDKVKEIVINLCGNSIKYTAENGKIEIGIKRLSTEEVGKSFGLMESISAKNETAPDSSLQNAIDEELRKMVGENQLVIYVKDNGIGLSDDDIAHLFKKFSRVGDYTTQEVQGTGLGLYLSKALAEMQHGRLWATSEGREKGSSFFLALPEAKCEDKIKELDSKIKIAKDAKPLAKSENNY